MSAKENVIDFAKKRLDRKARSGSTEPGHAEGKGEQAPVVDITDIRAEMLSQERRQVRRTILTEFVGAHVVVPQKGLMKVALYDISDGGLAFDVDPKLLPFQAGEEVAMRVYLNKETYFPFIAKIQHVRLMEEEGVTRFGGTFVKGTVNDQALFHFVKFIETVSASLKTDSGDLMVSNLRRG